MPLLQSFGPLHSPPTSAPFGLPAGGGVTPFSCAAGSSGEITEQAVTVNASAASDPRAVVFIVRAVPSLKPLSRPTSNVCNFLTLLDELAPSLNHCAICAILHWIRWINVPPGGKD